MAVLSIKLELFNENSVLHYSLITLQPNKNKGNIST